MRHFGNETVIYCKGSANVIYYIVEPEKPREVPLSSDTIPIGKREAAQFNKLYPECSRSSVS
jgi:hypothetical protein